MAARSDTPDLLQAARCEDLLPNQIREVSVVGPFEEQIISTLKQGGAHLLEGARGTGKSMLLRLADIEMDLEFMTARRLPVYVSFKTSTLLEGVKAGQNESFQVWVNAKILQALHDHLVYLDLIGSPEETDPTRAFLASPPSSLPRISYGTRSICCKSWRLQWTRKWCLVKLATSLWHECLTFVCLWI